MGRRLGFGSYFVLVHQRTKVSLQILHKDFSIKKESEINTKKQFNRNQFAITNETESNLLRRTSELNCNRNESRTQSQLNRRQSEEEQLKKLQDFQYLFIADNKQNEQRISSRFSLATHNTLTLLPCDIV
ncbi:hypothetical protein COF76_22535 [Bacillus wiedmannii]|uniref:hypothetical protein n=1 Tax=Bacillus wiedmannii TaxID=1890302 RepID=UPI000BFE1CDD|nr:hypothetical protein [Bacillus wiedmannii]PHE95053.1 hypothetical protein COF76_22535 [Bacillus wiedmannii]